MPKDPNVEAAKLRQEAIDIMNRTLLGLYKIPNGDGTVNCPDAERLVDCIISAATLQTVAIMGEAFNGTNAPTDKSADTTSTHTCGGSCNCHQS